jgi:hypothetical protein
VKDDLFFVFGGNVSDIELRNKFTGAKQWKWKGVY